MKRLAFVLLLGATVGALAQSPADMEPILENGLETVAPASGQVRFEATPDSQLGKYDPRRHQWTPTFTLDEGGRFYLRGRHGRLEFTLKAIEADGVVIEARPLTGGDATTMFMKYR